MIVHTFSTVEETARGLILHLLDWLKHTRQPTLTIALSGGNTPKTMFDLWAAEFADITPWNRIEFFWVDERCVDPTDAESNYGMTYEHLLSKVPMPAEQVFRIQGENQPEAEAARYSRLVAEHVPQLRGLPCFDVVLLGAGDDGHTSSIFPGQENLLTTQDVYAVARHPQSGQIRVALTGRPILNAKKTVFLMTGEKKAPVLQAFYGTSDSGPAAYVAHHARNQVEVFVDETVNPPVSN